MWGKIAGAAGAVVVGTVVETLLSDSRRKHSSNRRKKSKKETPSEDKSTDWSEWEYKESVGRWLTWRLNSAGEREHRWSSLEGEASTKYPTPQEPAPSPDKPTSPTNPSSTADTPTGKAMAEDEASPAITPFATSLPIEQRQDNGNVPYVVNNYYYPDHNYPYGYSHNYNHYTDMYQNSRHHPGNYPNNSYYASPPLPVKFPKS